MLSISRLDNGLALIVEEMKHVESAAYVLYMPGGVLLDDEASQGASLIIAELTSRGAGHFDSRGLSEAFDALGIRHSEAAGHDVFAYRGSLLAESLGRALEYVSLMVRQPTLPETEIENIRSLLLQDIQSLEDNPAAKAAVGLNERYYPAPYGRSTLGTIAGLDAVTPDKLRMEWRQKYKPAGSVLSIVGNVATAEVAALVEEKFGSWAGQALERPAFGELPPHACYHIPSDSAQCQIMLAYPSAPFAHPDYYTAKVATAVLSGGMFGRLFVEVREKRGLCYSVYARHSATRDYGTLQVYAGTTPERAQETLDVVISQLRGLAGTVSDAEMTRAKVDLLASLTLGEESTSSRASSNAGDWWVARRVRSLTEIQAEINKVSIKDVDEYLARFPADSFMLLTLGSRALQR